MSHYRNMLSLISVLPAVALLGRSGSLLPAGRDTVETKVLICHNAGPSKQIEIEVAESAVAAHVEQHGDTIGSCDAFPETLLPN